MTVRVNSSVLLSSPVLEVGTHSQTNLACSPVPWLFGHPSLITVANDCNDCKIVRFVEVSRWIEVLLTFVGEGRVHGLDGSEQEGARTADSIHCSDSALFPK